VRTERNGAVVGVGGLMNQSDFDGHGMDFQRRAVARPVRVCAGVCGDSGGNKSGRALGVAEHGQSTGWCNVAGGVWIRHVREDPAGSAAPQL
jgi:hypothetical protein